MAQTESLLRKRISDEELSRVASIAEHRAAVNRENKLLAAQLQLKQSDSQYQCKQKEKMARILSELDQRAMAMAANGINVLPVIALEEVDLIRKEMLTGSSCESAEFHLKRTSAVFMLMEKFVKAGFDSRIEKNCQNEYWLTIRW